MSQQQSSMHKTPSGDASLAQWLHYISEIHPTVMDLGLQRVRQVAQTMSLCQLDSTVITVAGTNGKGSCVRVLESLYLTAGYSVCAYTSPHLLQFNERLRICGQEVADHMLVRAFVAVEQARGTISLSYFEFTTLAILECVRQVGAEIAILEVGLGGRLDAVNVVEPDIAVITNIDFDHMQFLGDSREQIGFEKAGIMRAAKPVVCGDPEPPVSIARVAADVAANLYQLNKEYSYQSNDQGWEFSGPAGYWLGLPLVQFKKQNVATALAVAQLLLPQFPLVQEDILQALTGASLAGRFERPVEPKRCVLDVAHNPQAMGWLQQQLQALQITGRIHLVVGMLRDKQIRESLQQLQRMVDAWYLASIDDVRGATASLLLDALEQINAFSNNNCYTFADVASAFESALQQRGPDDWIVVCGSFHTVAGVKQRLIQFQEELS